MATYTELSAITTPPVTRMLVAYPRKRDNNEEWWRAAKWNRPLTSDEVAALNADPYCFLVKE